MADRYNYQLTIEGDMSEADRKWVDIYCEELTCADESEQLYFGFELRHWEYEDDLENLPEYLPGRQFTLLVSGSAPESFSIAFAADGYVISYEPYEVLSALPKPW